MANPARSLDTILDTQTDDGATHNALPWYGKMLATGILALAPLVGVYAGEPAKADAVASCVTLTKEEETYVKRFEDKVNAAKIKEPDTTKGSLEAAYERAGRLAMNKKSYVVAAAYLNKSIQLRTQLRSDLSWSYELMSIMYLKMASEERDPKAKNAYSKECVKYGEQALAILHRMAATSG